MDHVPLASVRVTIINFELIYCVVVLYRVAPSLSLINLGLKIKLCMTLVELIS